ncbi:MAG: family intrarane metalloprotease [Caulobacteraceae bacterium]|nr:family intrarane metalloprotease [Caulobacteraceae bacterium]
MDKLSPVGRVSPPQRLYARLISSLTTWPDAAGWGFSAAVGVAALAAVWGLGFSSGLYALHAANLNGMPIRLLTVLVAPAFGEEAVFRGLLIPSRSEADRPALQIIVATTVFIAWHLVEAKLILPQAATLFERPDFLACAGLVGFGCAVIRWRTGSLWPAVALHWLMVTIWQTWLGGITL